MVMTSAQMAQMHGSFQGQTMNQMAYSSQIGQQSPYSGERMAGGAMNTLGAVGAPAAMGGMALMGLDPFSMAISGGIQGAASGGLAGAGAGALAAGGLAAGGVMAAGWAGGQFMQGAQQHQQLGQGLRSSFNFRNQQGGSGFTGGQVGQIGSMMRDMSKEQGAGGEMTNFDELGRLASNMGRMGMSQGVRNAKDFTEKFKTMVSSLKEIATEMGTSLEEAQKMMAGMKQSGVFGAKNQVAMSKAVRAGASAGGMATSELTGMASVGSQISRMVGGKGSSGAAAGVKTITDIGVAQKMGVLSEEDIYNQTGQTGAMGRRAMASAGMQRAARFYKSGMGRRMLASMAGKDGKLDEEDADEIEGGGVSVGRTREMWKKNMKGVGRANFIRNEGRLRGEALKRFGAMGPSIWMKGLLEQKGIDVNEDNDKAMLFLQRRMKMGRDEADNELKMIKNLPAIMREKSIVARSDASSQKMAERQKGVGIEGLKRKFDSAVADVKGDIQQLGADAMEGLSNEFEGIINRLTNTRVKTFSKSAARAQAGLIGGGTSAQKEFASQFGLGGGGVSKSFSAMKSKAVGKSDSEHGKDDFFSMLGMGASFSDEFDRDGGDREQLAKKGYDVAADMGRGKTEARLTQLRAFADAAGTKTEGMKLGEGSLSSLNAVHSNLAGKKGLARATALEKELLASDSKELRAMGRQLQKAEGAEKGKIIAGIGAAAQWENEGENYKMPDSVGVYDTTGYLTANDAAEDIGRRLMGGNDDRQFGRHHLGRKGISKDVQDAMGNFARTDAGRDILAAVASTDSTVAADAKKTLQQNINTLENKDDLSVTEKGELNFMKRLRASKKVAEAAGDPAKLEKIRKEEGFNSIDELEKTAGAMASLAEGTQRERRAQLDSSAAKKRIKGMEDAGAIDEKGNLVGLKGTVGKDGKVTGKFDEGAETDFMTAMMEGDTAMAEMTSATAEAAGNTMIASEKRMTELSTGMTVSQKRQLSKKLRKMGQKDRAAGISGDAGRQELLEKGGKGRRLRNLTGMLGSDLSRDDIVESLGKDQKTEEGIAAGTEDLANTIMEDLQLTTGENKERLKTAIKAQREGDSGGAQEALKGIMSSDEFKERKKEKDDADAVAKDPLQAKANEHLSTISDHIQAQTKSMNLVVSNTQKEKEAE